MDAVFNIITSPAAKTAFSAAVTFLWLLFASCVVYELMKANRILTFVLMPFAIVLSPVLLPFAILYERTKKVECEKERADFERIRKETLESFRDALTKGASIYTSGTKEDVCGIHMPDGEVLPLRLAFSSRTCFFCNPPSALDPGDDPDSLLASADVMLIREGKYKEEAAERLVEETKDKCLLLQGSSLLYFPRFEKFIVGIESGGKVLIVRFDLLVRELFRDVPDYWRISDGKDACSMLLDRLMTAEEVIREQEAVIKGTKYGCRC